MVRRRKGQHIKWYDRLQIEQLLNYGLRPNEISKVIGCCRATVYNEIKRAEYVHRNTDLTEEMRYSPEKAEERYQQNLREKGAPLKIYDDDNLAKFITHKICEEKYSPEAVLLEIKRENLPFDVEIQSVNTIYSYIRKGVFQGVTLQNLPVLRNAKNKKQTVVRCMRLTNGTSIDQRPEEVMTREEFGHWEMDSVVGKLENEKALLVLTERKTRDELIEVVETRKSEEVVEAIERLKEKYGSQFYRIFKSITIDNGGEFRNVEALEAVLSDLDNKVDLYYCHPYRSCERGSNENQNRFIRRFYPKGTDFDKALDRDEVLRIQIWMNNYPRRMFGGKTSSMLFEEEIAKLDTG